TSFLPVHPAADPRPGSSAPAGRASGRAGLHGEEMGPARPLAGRASGRAGLHGEEMGPARPFCGGAVALGGALMMIVCAYIGRCDHTSTNAPDPVRTLPLFYASFRPPTLVPEARLRRVRSYQHQCTGSHQNSAVKRDWARVLLGWVTSWEVLVLHLFFSTSFLPVLPAADPRPGSSGPVSRASGWAALHGEEMGPARPLGGGAVALGGALMMIVCDHTSTNAPDPIRTPQLSVIGRDTSFLPVLPAADPRPGSSGPVSRASGWAGLHGEEMGPARPLGGGAVALVGVLMMIVCAYIGSTSFLPVHPAADPRPGSSAPAGRASGRAGLHGEEMGPARPLGGGAVALGGALMMIVCAYIGRCDHTSTNAPDPVRTPHTSFLLVLPAADPLPGSSAPAGRASGRAGLHGEEMGPARPFCGGAVALGGALMMIVCAYIGSTSFLLVLPAAGPLPGRSAPAGRASGRARLHGEEMGPARPFCGGAVALGGALMMIVCAYIGRCDHTSTNAPDPVRT
ncbi:hypothetical protein PIB30_103541, partial [Stylosanthes scabra]|nr:hypothetical protein [Stylosanthes scabra]